MQTGTDVRIGQSFLISAGRVWGYAVSGDMIVGPSSSWPERTHVMIPEKACVKVGNNPIGVSDPEIESYQRMLFSKRGVISEFPVVLVKSQGRSVERCTDSFS